VSGRVEGDIHRCTWRDVARRSRQLARALDAQGVSFSGRVATLAWNGYRHLELYFGVSGSGRVLHTMNPRLPPEQLAWIANHAEDEVLCFDLSFLPLVQAIQSKCPTIRSYVALCDDAHLPTDSGLPGLTSYESWIGRQPTHYDWPVFDENSASSMCYTSGTTGNPKAALYSHRSTILHTYASCMVDTLGLSAGDCILPVTPMFHVNGWGIPYGAALTGCKLVLPGPAMDGKSVYNLIESEEVTCAAGVPTIFQMLLAHIEANKLSFSSLQRAVVGGAACPPSMLEAFTRLGVELRQAWGMTETSPIGTLAVLKRKHLRLPFEQRDRLLLKQGRSVYGVDMRVVDSNGREAPWDGETFGDLEVRGWWVIQDYFKNEGRSPLDDGWFRTGEVATIDPDGYMQITDRTKDVIKSGGEWISSIAIENVAMSHPAIQMAACIGVPHPKWDERPIIVAVKRPGAQVSAAELIGFYEGKVAKWQIPDDVVFVDAIPLGATGKMLKIKLRETLRDYVLPASAQGRSR